ncbi:YiiX/YebB-like N1pC/P60 family cysteine hydrolase [Soonwooa sp.]|uniref:YiiX/YebB-like N1pC/P60 family cysteine hydrolase n=2 Tax=Soonwooa sp. TaxID=1938592 RepID=UPI0035AF9239
MKLKLFFVGLCLIIVSCASHVKYKGVENGDLLFVTAQQEGLSGAINNVTQKEESANYDHIGLVEKDGKDYFVLHAAPRGGSQRQAMSDFVKEQKQKGQHIVVYRLKNPFQKSIPYAIEQANSLVGKPYNFDYILSENAYYCSDFIERSFRKDDIFKLEPMTFVDPKTGVTNVFWKDFYQKKNLEVPEGKLGCNPNGLAASEKLERIKILD